MNENVPLAWSLESPKTYSYSHSFITLYSEIVYLFYYCENFASEDYTQGGKTLQFNIRNLVLELFNRVNFFDVVG